MRIAAILAGAAAIALTAVAAAAQAPSGRLLDQPPCRPSRVHYERSNWGDPSIRSLPWVAATPGAVALVGHLFYYDAFPSVRWGRIHARDFRIYAGGRSRDGRVNMKILWSGPDRLSSSALILRGTNVATNAHFRQKLQVGPAIVNVPQAGCWRLALRTGPVTARLTVVAVRS